MTTLCAASQTEGQLVDLLNEDPVPGVDYDLIDVTGSNSVTMLPGTTALTVRTFGTSTYTQVGGQVSGIQGFIDSTINLQGGSVTFDLELNGVTANLTGGTIQRDLEILIGATASLSGTDIGRRVLMTGDSSLSMTGGSITDELYLTNGANVFIWATGFDTSGLNANPDGSFLITLNDLEPGTDDIFATEPLPLNLTFAGGSLTSFDLRASTEANTNTWTGSLTLYDTDLFEPGSITPVPEPAAAAALLGLASIAFLCLRRRGRKRQSV